MNTDFEFIEKWQLIDGYGELYSVSTGGKIINKYGKILNQYLCKSTGTPYYVVYLYRPDKTRKTKYVHRLVAETFLKDRNETVNHIDGNKLNNNLSNLEWVSRKDNNIHAFRLGLLNNNGELSGLAKLTNKDVKYIKENHKKYLYKKDIAKEFNTSRATISNILNNKSWKCVEILA